jgi:serine phosphatase RsbU (regulator of sigma subunit)
MATSGKQSQQRRSILVKPAGIVGELPLWKSLLITYGVFIPIVLVLSQVDDTMPDLEFAGTIGFFFLLFGTPVTILAHYGSELVRRYGGRLTKSRQTLAIVSVWLISGAAGSLAAYGVLPLMHVERVPFIATWMLPLILGNGLIAIVIGTFVLFFQAAEDRIRRRNVLIDQEEMLAAELQAARSVQRSLLPDEDVNIHGFDISATMAPAVEIGGDYYDYLSFANGTKAILVADAAGKGVPAALVMAKFQGMAQALSIHVSTPEEFFIGLNDTLRVRLDRRNFITVGMLTIDFEDRCAFYRAGHNPLLVYRVATGRVESFRTSGIALGLTHGANLGNSLCAACFTMECGDVALIYSDGLTEALNPAGSEYGEERVCESLRAASSQAGDAVHIRSMMLSHLATFVGSAEPHDDITLVVVMKT